MYKNYYGMFRRAKKRSQGGSERNKYMKMQRREDKRGQSHINILQVNVLVCPSTVPDQCSLSCFVIKLHF